MIGITDIIYRDVINMLPARPANAHKGTFGTLTIVAGSRCYIGAAALCVLSALRCGIGIVRLASVESVIAAVASSIHECTFAPLLSSPDGSVSLNNVDEIVSLSTNSSAVLVGCGMSNCHDTHVIVDALFRRSGSQIIADADALNSIAGEPEIIRFCGKTPIITPHTGEMSRLCGISIGDIKSNPAETASEFSVKYNCVTVLKDYITYIAGPDGKVWRNTTGNSGLARGGSGDLLAGMIAALAAQGLCAADAAVCGVFLHGLAADRCAKRLSDRGMLPSDILEDLCGIFLEAERNYAE